MVKIRLIDDGLLGVLIRISFGFHKLYNDKIHIVSYYKSEPDNLQQELDLSILNAQEKLFTLKTTLSFRTIPSIRAFAKNLINKAQASVSFDYSSGHGLLLKQADELEKLADYLEQKYRMDANMDTNIDHKDFVKTIHYPEIAKTLHNHLIVSEKQLPNLKTFIKRYYQAYRTRSLAGQERWPLPDILENQILSKINDPLYTKKFGFHRVVIAGSDIFGFCHTLLYLHKKGQIKLLDLREIPIKTGGGAYQTGWEAELDNHSLDSAAKLIAVPLPEGVQWVSSEERLDLKFTDGKKLEFLNIEKPIAKYFKMLIENHGLPVKHNQVRSTIPGITNSQIRNLVKALRKKIELAALGRRIKIESKNPGAYTLTIT